MGKVAIIGVGQTTSEMVKREIFYDVTAEASRLALEDAGLERRDIDNVVLGEYDLAIGRTASHMYTVPAVGGFYRDEIRVNDDGLFAAVQAYLGIASGEYDITLVASSGISSEAPQEKVTNLQLDPFFHRPLGLFDWMANAMQAERYQQRYGIIPEQSAGVVVKNRRNAAANPYAYLRDEITVDEVLSSPYAAYPLRQLECATRADGACAVIMASESTARRICRMPVWIAGLGWFNDTYYLGDKELSELGALRLAAGSAYKMAGIKNPAEEINVAEVYDVTAYHELMACEALGFCGPGEGGRLIDEELTEPAGGLPVNPSGGLTSSYILAASGLARLVETAIQLTGRAQSRQVPGCRTALAQSMTGWGNQRACVAILRR